MPSAVTTGVVGVIRPQVPAISEAIDAWAADMLRQRCKSRSIDRFTRKVRECAAYSDWTLITSPTLADASRWLSHKVETAGWSPPTHDQACSILRCFGSFLHKHYPKDVPVNPLEHLESSGEQGGEGSRALRTAEARAMIAEALRRMRSDRRSRGNPAGFLSFLCYTGLRHDEAGSCRWKDVDLDADVPAIYTDPAWSKNKRRMRVVLHPEIVSVLNWQRTLVPRAPGDLVWPVSPNRHTWQKIREAAGVDDEDSRGRAATYHSCRKWLATELDRVGASPGVVSRVLRHAGSLAEERYIDPDASAEVAAVTALPSLWPENEKEMFRFFIDKPDGNPDTDGVTTANLHTHEETPVPGRDAGQRSSQTRPGSCPAPASFRGTAGLIEHGNAHFRVQSGSEGLFELEPLTVNHVAGVRPRVAGGGSLSQNHTVDANTMGCEADRGPEDRAGGANMRMGADREGSGHHRESSGFSPGSIHRDGGAPGSVAGSVCEEVIDVSDARRNPDGARLDPAQRGDLRGNGSGCGHCDVVSGVRPSHSGVGASGTQLEEVNHGESHDFSGGGGPLQEPDGRLPVRKCDRAPGQPVAAGVRAVAEQPAREPSSDLRRLANLNGAPGSVAGSENQSPLRDDRGSATDRRESGNLGGDSHERSVCRTRGLPQQGVTSGVESNAYSGECHRKVGGYATGYECYLGSGCVFKTTVTQCLLCCSANCGGSLLQGCQDACIGVGGATATASTLDAVAKVADRIQSGKLSPIEMTQAVDFVVLACNAQDERVAHAARLVASETPIVSALVQ